MMMNPQDDVEGLVGRVALGAPDVADEDRSDSGPECRYVMMPRRVTLSNGRTVAVKVLRREGSAPWSDDDERALRTILDVASAIALPHGPVS